METVYDLLPEFIGQGRYEITSSGKEGDDRRLLIEDKETDTCRVIMRSKIGEVENAEIRNFLENQSRLIDSGMYIKTSLLAEDYEVKRKRRLRVIGLEN